MINFQTNKKYTNRYRDEYYFEETAANHYTIKGGLDHWRMGGKEGELDINVDDLGMIDPSGGPFLTPNFFAIDGYPVKRIYTIRDGGFGFETSREIK
jgi:hypothetical protein